jgi:hypothetical protein
MAFDPEAIERLSPSARVEVQDYYARKFLAEVEPHQPERRRAMKIKHQLDGRMVSSWPKPWTHTNNAERLATGEWIAPWRRYQAKQQQGTKGATSD